MCVFLDNPHRVRARKPHRCDWCGGRIEKGDEYTVSTLVGDYIYSWHECDRCREYVDELWEWYRKWYGPTDTLGAEAFDEFMREEHPDTWREWKDGC